LEPKGPSTRNSQTQTKGYVKTKNRTSKSRPGEETVSIIGGGWLGWPRRKDIIKKKVGGYVTIQGKIKNTKKGDRNLRPSLGAS